MRGEVDLVSAYRWGMERWTELVETYRNHSEASDDPHLKIEILLAMGEVYERQIQDVTARFVDERVLPIITDASSLMRWYVQVLINFPTHRPPV